MKYYFILMNYLLMLITAIWYVYPVNAASLENWEVDGLNGGILVSASLTAAPCSLSSESEEQAVDLGIVSRPFMTNGGLYSSPVALHFILNNCLSGESISQPEHGGAVAVANNQSGILIKLRAAEDSDNHNYFKLYGSAKGIALKIADVSRNEIHPDERSWSQFLDRGRNDLVLNVQVARTNVPLEFGEYHAVIYLDLEYH